MDLRTVISENTPRPIPELSLPDPLRILTLAPHPDDFDAVGVTMKFFLRNGHSVGLAVVRTGSGVEDAYRPGLTLEGKASLREQEQRRSLHFFGLPEKSLTFLPLSNDTDDQPVDCPENTSAIETILRQEAPDIVVLPHSNDTNSGHRVMYSLFTQAAQRLDQPLVAWLNRDPKTIGMRTDLYMPFEQEEADWKATLLRCHDSQHQRNLHTRGHGFDDRILDTNRTIAHELSLAHEYAEAFEIELHNTAEK